MTASRRCGRATKAAGTLSDDEAATDPEAALAIQLLESAQYEGLKPTELACLYRRLMILKGWSITRVAKELSLTQPSVTRALKLLELPESVQRLVDQGVLSPAAAYEITQLGHSEDQVEVAGRVAAERLRRDEVRSLIGQKKAGGRPTVAAWRPLEFRAGLFMFRIAGPVDDESALRKAGLEILNRLRDVRALREAGLEILSRLSEGQDT